MKRKLTAAAILISAVAVLAQVSGWNPINQDTWFKGRVAISDSLTTNSGVRTTKGVRADSVVTTNDVAAGGNVTGGNVTSGANPGHTHTTTSVSALDGADITTGTVDEARLDANVVLDTEVPGGDLGGTYGTPSVDDDSHNHTASTISGLGSADITDDTITSGDLQDGGTHGDVRVQDDNASGWSGLYFDSDSQLHFMVDQAGSDNWGVWAGDGAGWLMRWAAGALDIGTVPGAHITGLSGDVTGNGTSTVVGNDSHNHTSSTVSALDAANDISSGTLNCARLDADLNDLCDGSLTGSKVGSGISGTNVTTGTVDDARIDGAGLAGDGLTWDAANTEFDAGGGFPSYYLETDAWTGCTADTACDAGYHMCLCGEWLGMAADFSLSPGVLGTGVYDTRIWCDSDANEIGSEDGDCSDWSICTSGNTGHTGFLSQSTADEGVGRFIEIRHQVCTSTFSVYCCKDP